MNIQPSAAPVGPPLCARTHCHAVSPKCSPRTRYLAADPLLKAHHGLLNLQVHTIPPETSQALAVPLGMQLRVLAPVFQTQTSMRLLDCESRDKNSGHAPQSTVLCNQCLLSEAQ